MAENRCLDPYMDNLAISQSQNMNIYKKKQGQAIRTHRRYHLTVFLGHIVQCDADASFTQQRKMAPECAHNVTQSYKESKKIMSVTMNYISSS